MHKLLIILNAMVKNRTPWQANCVFPLDIQDGCYT